MAHVYMRRSAIRSVKSQWDKNIGKISHPKSIQAVPLCACAKTGFMWVFVNISIRLSLLRHACRITVRSAVYIL